MQTCQRRFSVLAPLAVLLLVGAASGQSYNQRVPYETCQLVADTSQCFSTQGGTIPVGSNVSTLGELFRVCMGGDTITAGGGAIRVMLAIDHSGSMCTWHNNGTTPPNDSTDQRIVAAHAFVDSLAARNPGSEVGVVRFRHSCAPENVLNPLPVGDPAGLQAIHEEISDARCLNSDPYFGKELAGLDTYQGCATWEALQALEVDYDPADDRARHVILLTDDGWTVDNDSTAQEVIAAYEAAYPGREIPTVHSVFMSSSATSTDPNLQYIADQTGGQFIPNASPDDIVQRFMDILDIIAVGRPEALYVSRITDLNTGQQLDAIITKVEGATNDYYIRLADWPLQYGLNQLQISRIYQTTDGLQLGVISDTLRIDRRADLVGDSTGTLFSLECGLDSSDIFVRCSPQRPQRQLVDRQVSVEAYVPSGWADYFSPGDVTVRALTRFPTGESGAVAHFRLDGSLVDYEGDADGSGTVSYDNVEAAFGSSLSGGSFTAPVYGSAQQLNAFTIEAWVRVNLADPTGAIVSGSGYELGVDATGRLVFSSGGAVVRSAVPIARNIWLHVAVVYSSGSARLFVNGVPFSSPMTMTAISMSTVTVGPFGSGHVDEVRISNVNRASTSGGITAIPLPTADGLTWMMPTDTTTGASGILAQQAWAADPRGRVGFFVTSPLPADVVVNLYHEDANALWSVNGNPVQIYSTSVIDAVPSTAYLYDTDGNGYLDQVTIQLPDSVRFSSQIPDVSTIVEGVTLTLYDGSRVTLSAADLVSATDSTLTISLNETGGAAQTGWSNAVVSLSSAPLTADGRPVQVVDVVDMAGPVVVRAVYTGGPDGADVLRVTFSEPVVWQGIDGATPEDVFVYWDAGAASAVAFDGLDASNLDSLGAGWQAVIVMDNGFAVTPMEDSLQLEGLITYVQDSLGNRPPADGNKVPVEWGGDNTVTVSSGPSNPFRPGRDPLPQAVVDFYGDILPPGGQDGGIVVAINTDKPLKPIGTDPGTGRQKYGTANVYDAVSNLVADKLPVLHPDAGGYGDYAVFWGGRNTRGRIVGGGAYLMVLKVKLLDGKEETKRLMIGVKHAN